MRITTDSSAVLQTMTGFGVSGAWWAQAVGKWTSYADGVPAKDKIASLLFDPVNGIGVQIYRYNLGGGSAQSGKGEYSDPLRRAETFYTPTGPDFSRDKAAVYMMRQAVKQGARQVVFFVNTPPEALTKNGLGHTSRHRVFRTNISRKNVPAFCRCSLDAAEHFRKEGIPVTHVSPVNEPLWIWNGGQEGCHYSPRQTAYVLRVFAREMKKREALAGVRLAGAENGDIRWFNKAYTRAVMKYKEVRELTDGIDLHSYFLPSPLPRFFNDRPGFLKRYRRYMDRRYPGVPVNVSEWTHMKGGRDAGMTSALEQAKVMHEDITLLGASSWQHWIACSPYDYCDGLIYIDNEKETFSLTKRYYAFGNFSKFIPVGAKRIRAFADDKDLLVSAYRKDGKTVIVAVNPSEEPKTVSFPRSFRLFVTDEDSDLAERLVPADAEVRLTPRSVNTLLFENE